MARRDFEEETDEFYERLIRIAEKHGHKPEKPSLFQKLKGLWTSIEFYLNPAIFMFWFIGVASFIDSTNPWIGELFERFIEILDSYELLWLSIPLSGLHSFISRILETYQSWLHPLADWHVRLLGYIPTGWISDGVLLVYFTTAAAFRMVAYEIEIISRPDTFRFRPVLERLKGPASDGNKLAHLRLLLDEVVRYLSLPFYLIISALCAWVRRPWSQRVRAFFRLVDKKIGARPENPWARAYYDFQDKLVTYSVVIPSVLVGISTALVFVLTVGTIVTAAMEVEGNPSGFPADANFAP